jgi:hypothetical protein
MLPALGSQSHAWRRVLVSTITDVEPLRKLLLELRPAPPLRHGALTVIPLLGPPGPDLDWLTLPEAGDALLIEEIGEAGSVPTLRATNAGDRPVLLLDGEELVGAKQNRVLNTTVLVAARARLDIPVSCVEQGRWAYRTRRFTGSDAALFASARARKAARVSESLRSDGRHSSDQWQIWEDVALMASQHRVTSPTGAMRDFYDRYAADVGAARTALAPRAGQVGALVFLAGRWVGLDVLASPRLFAQAWPRLAAGYAADAIGRRRSRAKLPDAVEILGRLARVEVSEATAVGRGREHRLGGDTTAGAALVVDDVVAHLMAFPVVGAGGPTARR